MAMAITIKLKHATFVQQAHLPLEGNLNVYYALMAAQPVHQKIILHLTLHVQHVFLIMDMLTELVHYVLEIRLLKVDKLFVLTAQVDVISAMELFAHHARVIISYLTILVKFALIALSHWEVILLSALHAAATVLAVMRLAVLPAKTAPL